MQEFLVNLLISFSTLIGVNILNIPDSDNWTVTKSWEFKQNSWYLEAKASTSICANTKQFLSLPQVIHGVQKVYADDILLYSSGDESFKKSSSFYQTGYVSCDKIKNHKTIRWEVYSYSKYFARLTNFPLIDANAEKKFFLNATLNVMGFSAVVVLSLLGFFIFYQRVEPKLIISYAVGGLGLGIYSLMSASSFFNIEISMLNAHKIADLSINLAFTGFFYFYFACNLIKKAEFMFFILSVFASSIIVLSGSNSDVVQFGTMVSLPGATIFIISFFINITYKIVKKKFNKEIGFQIASLGTLALCTGNDILHVSGLINSYMVLSVGGLAGIFFLAIAANENIEKTYQERDDLVKNLESKVSDQTKHLTEALTKLKTSQAELIQSSRLASLGTLSAGIAHEINNAINYVHGSIVPLERRVLKYVPADEKPMVERLLRAIKDGTNLTVEIVRSLRNFTGLNQSKFKEVFLKENLQSVLTILKSKLAQVKIETDVPDNIRLNCYSVGLNQIFMNIISNSIDAMDKDQKLIKISAVDEVDKVKIIISDNGCGMSDQVRERLFDPFFTTKEVGKGTGLGMHIVQKEIEKHNAKIEVNSKVGEGTSFVIIVPKLFYEGNQEAA
jgi:signal transduction histidine kinase